jgi:hypothetical protein
MITSLVTDSPMEMLEEMGRNSIKAVSRIYDAADPANKTRVKEAFVPYFQAYEDLYEAARQSQQEVA